MKQITIRNIPEKVEKAIQKEARRKGVSMSKAIISILERTVETTSPVKKKRTLYHDLDHLAGIWSKEEAKEFNKTMRMFEKIDEDVWK